MKNYYDTPPEEIFEDIKSKAISIRNTYDDTYGYATEKISIVKDLGNIKDNYAYIISMFDCINQKKLFSSINKETEKYLHEIEEIKYLFDDIDININ